MFPQTVLSMEVNVQIPVPDQLALVLDGVFEHIWRSPNQFASLVPAAPAPPPVPFLGRIDTARILTVGVSPDLSSVERGQFPEQVNSAAISGLLLDYFQRVGRALDDELGTWELVLRELGCSYFDGSAAHVYLTPRVVNPLDHSQHYLLKEMCRYDAPALLRVLEILREPRVLLTAGSVTPGRPVNAFLGEVAAEQQWRLLGEGQGEGCFVYHSLVSDTVCFDVFHAAASPQLSSDRATLVRGIQDQAQLIGLLVADSGRRDSPE